MLQVPLHSSEQVSTKFNVLEGDKLVKKINNVKQRKEKINVFKISEILKILLTQSETKIFQTFLGQHALEFPW